MEIAALGANAASNSISKLASSAKVEKDANSFQKTLGDAVNSLTQLDDKADDAVTRLAAGEAMDFHTVMIASEEANIGFQLALQVRNKLVEAYQEIMRMQV